MRDRSLIPTNLTDWPRVAPLLPELKLILGLGFWGGRYTNSIGVASIPMRPLAASLGLDPSALEGGIKTLCVEQLLIGDGEKLEFFIRDWFRFHTFKGTGVAIARREFLKVGSEIIRRAVIVAAPWLGEEANEPIQLKRSSRIQGLMSPTAATKPTAASAAGKIRVRRESGIVTFLPTDPDRAFEIEQAYSADQINAAVISIERRGKEAVPGLVQKELESRIRRVAISATATQALDAAIPLDRDQREKGLSQAWAILGKEHRR